MRTINRYKNLTFVVDIFQHINRVIRFMHHMTRTTHKLQRSSRIKLLNPINRPLKRKDAVLRRHVFNTTRVRRIRSQRITRMPLRNTASRVKPNLRNSLRVTNKMTSTLGKLQIHRRVLPPPKHSLAANLRVLTSRL